MDKTFAELNPVVTPAGFDNYKIVAVILNKLLCNQVLSSIDRTTDKIIMEFEEFREQSKTTKRYYRRSNEKKFTLEHEVFGSNFCEVVYNFDKQLVRTTYNLGVRPNLDFENTNIYTKELDTNQLFQLSSSTYVGYKIDEVDGEISIPSANRFISNLNIFENSIFNELLQLCLMQSYNGRSRGIDVNLGKFVNIVKKGAFDGDKLPSNTSVVETINNILTMKENKVKNIAIGPLRFGYDAYKKHYNISFAGTRLVREFSINRFKYEFHPGLYVIVKYLEDNNLVERVNHRIYKEIFKGL